MQHLTYSIRYSAVSINSSPLTITLYYSVTTVVCNDKIFSTMHDITMEFDYIWGLIHKTMIMLINPLSLNVMKNTAVFIQR
jgi:hypothetical protein